MAEILTRAGCFVAIIVLGYLLKKFKFFPDSAFTVLSKIVIKVTLPAAIALNYAGKTFDMSLLVIILLGLGGNVCFMAKVGNDHFGSQWLGYGRGNNVCACDVQHCYLAT